MPSHDPAETLGLDVEILGVSYVSDRWPAVCAVCGRRADAEYSARLRVGMRLATLYLCEPCTIAALTVTFRQLASAITFVDPPSPALVIEPQSELPF